MKSTKYIFNTLIVFLLAHIPLYAQYTGGNADGNSLNEITNSACGNPAYFYAYFGGSGDGQGVHSLINSSCGTPPGGFAYMGGQGDAEAVQTITNAACGLPPGAYAYTGGNGDGESVNTLISQSCSYPAQFYAYFGGNGDGASMDKNRNCAIVLPTADFTATPTTVCVNGDVTFTDLSSNALGWEWTLTGATLVGTSTIYSQNPVVRYATAGTYTVTLKAMNLDGSDTITKTAYITVGGPATITATAPGSRCGSGSVTIGATSGGIIRWYAAASGGTLLGTGTTFTTPSISISTTYYAEAFNGCTASSRTAVIATVNTIPTITGTTGSVCDSGAVTISANPSAGTVSWYDASSGGSLLSTGAIFTTPSISTTTTYYAETTSVQGCTSTRIPVVATVNTTPTITSTTPASRCDAGSVTLNATSSAGSTIWYANASGGSPLATTNNFVTPSITGTTTFYVEAATGNCTSPRTPVIATVNATPSITSTTPATRCDSGVVTLGATASSGTLNWYSVSSGGTSLGTGTSFVTPSISSSQYFYVDVSTASCTSVRTAVLATVNLTPTVTGGNNSRCDAGTVTLTASANAGTISWYANVSGGSALGTGTSF
ncbi:MAG TPA: PKD domain-containing protein, partial [Flavobacterium sp.]|uniref:Ig-like domain-containing protein n=1 Tax=Flavobacterium sp. TaxID=239 RepID=UPI002CE38EF4